MDKKTQARTEQTVALTIDLIRHGVQMQLSQLGIDPNLVVIDVDNADLRHQITLIRRDARRYQNLRNAVARGRLLSIGRAVVTTALALDKVADKEDL